MFVPRNPPVSDSHLMSHLMTQCLILVSFNDSTKDVPEQK